MSLTLRYVIVITIGVAVRVVLLPGSGFPTDISAFEAWAVALATVGPHELYADVSGTTFPAVDYPPAYAYVLWLIGLISTHLCRCSDAATPLLHVLIKVPAVVADFALAALIGRLGARYGNEGTAFVAFTCALLAPPLWLVSAYWGQVDSIAALSLVAAISLALEKRFVAGWLVFALAVLTKPQSLVALPALFVWEAYARGIGLGMLKAAGAALALAYVIALPFAPVLDPLGVVRWIVERYSVGVNKYPNGSTGAFNLYGIGTNFYTSDSQAVLGIPLHTWGTALVVIALGALAVRLWSALRDATEPGEPERMLLFAVFLSLVALFMLATRMHERYLMPGLAVGAIVATYGRRAAIAEAIFAATFTVNCAFILAGFAGGKHHPITLTIGHALALANVATFVALAAAFFRPTARDGRRGRAALATRAT